MSLFSTLNVGRSGMFTAQQSLNTTSHNVSNANTAGFTKQRAKIVTNRAQSLGNGVGQVGTGSQVQAIERVRDNFLDYQVRNENSIFGTYDMRSSYLKQVEGVFNEPSDTGIAKLMSKFFDSWQELSKQPQSSNNRTVVVQQSLVLSDALNHTAKRLEDLRINAQNEIRNSVNGINSMLDQLNQLNKEITTVNISGNAPNDLMDKRDLLLDELSRKFGVSVEKEGFEGINIKAQGGTLSSVPPFVNASPNSDYSRLSYISSIDRDKSDPSGSTYKISYYQLGNMDSESNVKTLTLRDVTEETLKQIESSRVILSDSQGMAVKGDGAAIRNNDTVSASELMVFTPTHGELSGAMSAQNDLNDYIKQLDKMALGLALSVNAIHSGVEDPIGGSGYPDKDYMPFFVNSAIAKYNTDGSMLDLDKILEGESGITAANLTINKELLKDPMKLKTKTHDSDFAYTASNNLDGETDGERALAIAQLRNSMIKLQNIGETITKRADLFDLSKGGNRLINNGMTIENNTGGMNLEGYYKDIIDRLGVQSQEAQRMVENQSSLVMDIAMQRESVSGVNLDEETVNMVQFKHAYNANAKVISTVDELLDVVVNGLKR